ncbi:hypothetical protein L838_0010 [Mycobacterium avium MAV_120709_2344]|uniref:hypothetical protein n=1 Tax=Mycobacterium avium TaxID=1764 RepID=UPI00044A01F3|nr:hypothetical protein [Mycobacterium avium]ETZ58189.1 hypothetical protein L838_0010 [Mycobacterium avium MAV_120709_2344]
MSSSVMLAASLICGLIAAAIGHSKNRGILGSFLLGALLNVIGIVVVAMLPSGVPKAPPACGGALSELQCCAEHSEADTTLSAGNASASTRHRILAGGDQRTLESG